MSATYLILTGGNSSRFGSDKSQILINGQALIDRLLTNLPPGGVVIVGPSFEQDVRKVSFTQEHPLGTGPVAAIAAGLQELDSEEVIILATDMPFAAEIVPFLVPLSGDWEALIPLDSNGKRQPLCAKYRTSALVNALGKVGTPDGKSMRALLDNLIIEELIVDAKFTSKLVDIDTREDLAKVLKNLNKEIEEI